MNARTLRWLAPALAAVVGCGSPPTPEQKPDGTIQPVAVVPAVPVEPGEPKPADTPKPKPTDPPVSLPTDAGGKAVARALLLPAPLPNDLPKTEKPKKFASSLDRGDLPLPGAPLRPFSPVGVSTKPPAPTPPKDTAIPGALALPGTLPEGRATDKPPAKVAGPDNPKAADVPGGTPYRPDRAPLVDPSADLTAGAVIVTKLPIPDAALPFLKVVIPDPFEFVEHLKGKLGKDGELGTKPADVPPQK